MNWDWRVALKVGIASGSYIFTAGFIHDASLEERDSKQHRFELLDAPLKYYEPFPQEFLIWFIERAGYYHKKYGLYGIHTWLRPGDLEKPDYWEEVKRVMKENNIVFTHYGAPLTFTYTSEDYFRANYMPTIERHMALAEEIGCEIYNIAGPNTTWNRFRAYTLSMDKRLRLCSEHLRLMAQAATSYKFKFTIENHADYRVKEILKIVEMSGCDNILMNFDTGNAAIVVEDPVEVVKLVAPYTICAHIKDIKIDAPTYYGGRFLCTPIGKGDIDFRKIFEILADKSPSPSDLTLNIEPHTLEGIEDEIVDESLRYLKEELGDFLQN